MATTLIIGLMYNMKIQAFRRIKIDILSVKSADIMSFFRWIKKIGFFRESVPDTAVHIYIFSKLPLILSTVTDSKGNWSYCTGKSDR